VYALLLTALLGMRLAWRIRQLASRPGRIQQPDGAL